MKEVFNSALRDSGLYLGYTRLRGVGPQNHDIPKSWGGWIRTNIHGVKVRCPAFGRRPSIAPNQISCQGPSQTKGRKVLMGRSAKSA